MFLDLDKRKTDEIIAIDSSDTALRLGDVTSAADRLGELDISRRVVFLLCDNTVGALLSYLSTVISGGVPVMLSSHIDDELLKGLYDTYEPGFVWRPSAYKPFADGQTDLLESFGYTFVKTGFERYDINPELELLMTTSGSTGSPKLVRYKKGNLEANAENVAKAFGFDSSERPLCDLAINYTMGLNVVNTHLYAGAVVYLTNENIMSAEYWDFIKKYKLTNITNVPFGYELMLRLRFTRMELPYLKTLAQGGGRLSDKTFKALAEYAQQSGRRFIATFGTTETAARMMLLPPEYASRKTGSIGKPIPNGEAELIDENGEVITTPDTEGELVYRGPNVTMGYAVSREDLLKGDEFNGEYHTGDMAVRDSDGFYYIVGRRSRFLKMLGYRVSLDQMEKMIKERFSCETACTGSDDKMKVYVTDPGIKDDVLTYLCDKTGFYKALFDVKYISSLPKNETGKIMYKEL